MTCPPCGVDTTPPPGDDAGLPFTSGGGGATTVAAAPKESFSCAAAPEHSSGSLEIAIAGLVGISLVRGRKRGKR